MSSLIGKSVECVHDNGAAVEVVLSFIINNISYPSKSFCKIMLQVFFIYITLIDIIIESSDHNYVYLASRKYQR